MPNSSIFVRLIPNLIGKGRQLAQSKIIPIIFTLLVLMGLGVMVYNSRETLLTYDWQFRPIPFIISFAIYATALILAILGWGLIVNKIAGKRPWLTHIYIFCTTNITQRLPGIFWHVVGRMMMYQETGISKRSITISSGIEFFLLAISSLTVSLLTWAIIPSQPLKNPLLMIVGAALGLLFIQPFSIRWFMQKLKIDLSYVHNLHYYHILAWLSIYIVIWVLGGIILFAIISIIHPIALNTLPGIVSAWALSGTIALVSTFTPSGFGLREISLSLMLSGYMPTGVAVIIALLTRILLTLYEAFWALIVSLLIKK